MAFAISSNVPPKAGLYCAIVAGFLAALFSGSKTQVSGPTGAFVVVVAGIVTKYGLDGLFACTIMAGVILVILGATGLGTAVKFIPRPVVVGFTNGIALLIASTQIKDFFGLNIPVVPSLFLDRMVSIVEHWGTVSISASVLGGGALLTMIVLMRYARKVPGAIVALFVGTGVALICKLDVSTIGSRFKEGIPSGGPHLVLPNVSLANLTILLSPALTVAMLGAIESLMSATVADRLSKDKHNPNVELIAQGIGNIFSPLFGGLPATGAIARTATNIRAGAQSPIAGMIHALTLLTIVLVAAPLAKSIPLTILAAILLMVAYNMGEWKEIPQILKLSRADIAVWLVTFMLTVFADLTLAVEVGMILAALLYIMKVTSTTTVSEVTEEYIERGHEHSLQYKEIPKGVAIFRIHGPFLFGSTDKLADLFERIEQLPPVVILRLRNMTAIDATGIQALEDLSKAIHASGRDLIFCGMREQPRKLMEQANFARHVGEENICASVNAALSRAQDLMDRLRAANIA